MIFSVPEMADAKELLHKRGVRQKVFKSNDGKTHYIIGSRDLHYENNGSFDDINICLECEDTNKEYSKQEIVRKNSTTVGFRQDKHLEKFVGMRKGSKQYELTLHQIIIDGEPIQLPKTFVEITKLSENEIEHKINNDLSVYTRIGPISVKTALKVSKRINNCKLIYKVNLTGFKILNKSKTNGSREIYIEEGGFDFGDNLKIVQPRMWTEESTSNDIDHVLYKENNVFYYEKEINSKGRDWLDFNDPVYYIDATTINSTTADGYVGNDVDDSSWATCHDAATGDEVSSADNSVVDAIKVRRLTTKANNDFTIRRCFFYFDTSGVVGTILSCDLVIEGLTNADNTVAAQEGTQAATLTTADYDAFTGSTFGTTAWSTGTNTISFNSTGLAAINQAGTTKVCVRDNTWDVADSEPATDGTRNSGMYFADNGSNIPYLSLTIEGSGQLMMIS